MLKPPSLKDIARYPITATTGGAAIAVTALWWSRGQIDALMMNGEVWANWELWRALTAVLPHVNLLHLAFNLYWFWAFGTTLEKAYGHLRYVGILLVLAFGSSFAEF